MRGHQSSRLGLVRKKAQYRFACLLLIAILWMALAPHIAHIIALQTGKAWIELCSATGVKRIEVDRASVPLGTVALDDQNAPNAEHKVKQHCLYCSTQHDEVALITPTVSWHLRQLDLSQHWFGISLFLPPIRAIWSAHQTRAPPF